MTVHDLNYVRRLCCHLPSYVQTDYDVSSESLKNVPKWEKWQCCNKTAVWSSLKWFLIMTEHSVCTLDLVNTKCRDILAVLLSEAWFTLRFCLKWSNSAVFVPSVQIQKRNYIWKAKLFK